MIDAAMQIDNAHIGTGLAGGAAEIQLPLINVRAKLTQSDALDMLRSGRMSVEDAAAAWRARMGTISVGDLTVNWPDGHADLMGDLLLDQGYHLTGTLQGKSVQNGKTPAEFGLVFEGGGMRLAAASAPAGAVR
jgi:hypothetical protein